MPRLAANFLSTLNWKTQRAGCPFKMISFSNINKQYGKQLLFVDASFQLNLGGPARRRHAWRISTDVGLCESQGSVSVRSAKSTLGRSSPFPRLRPPVKLAHGLVRQCPPARLSFHRQISLHHGIALPLSRALTTGESSCDHK